MLREDPNPNTTSDFLPKGRITIVFTDIEDSTLMTADLGSAEYLEKVRNPQQSVLLKAFERHNGVAVHTAGDSFMAVFQVANDALACVVAIQNELAESPITATGPNKEWTLRLRIGVHTTEEDVAPDRLAWIPGATYLPGQVEYSGTDTNFAARIGGLGVGGQIVVSASAHTSASSRKQYRWQDWPNRRLKSFESAPESVWELLYDGQSRGEPGARWVPDWYRGELNRYIPRPELQREVIDHFKQGAGNLRRRLVTLYGEGGMGKSRLAVACALEMVGLFQDGIYFVDLARDINDTSILNRSSIAYVIGLALGFANEQLKPDILIASLKTSERLIVLDNYESVDSKEVRQFIRDLIVQTGSLCLLVTGRTPVSLPDVEQIISLNDGMPAMQAQSLFLAYARLTERGQKWKPTAEESKDLDRLLTLTEHIPLAVELAAAWAGSRSIKEIADGLEKTPLGRMTRTPGDTDRADPSPHHYSLTRSMDWTYGLLSKEAQHVFATMSLFDDGFRAEAVASIVAKDAEDVEDLVDALHRVSLVRRTEANKTTHHSLHRFTREYARVKFDHLADANAVRQRFVVYYRNLLEVSGDLNIASCRDTIALEWRNILAAVRIAEALSDWPSVLALADITAFLGLTGVWSEQESILVIALEAAKKAGDRRRESRTYCDLGLVYISLGRSDEALKCQKEFLSLSQELGDKELQGWAHNNVGNCYFTQGEYRKAESEYERGIAMFREVNLRFGEAYVLVSMGDVYLSRGHWSKSEEVCKESVVIFRELNDRHGEARALNSLGSVYKDWGKWDKAERVYSDSLAIHKEFGDQSGQAWLLLAFGEINARRGRWDEAENAFDESLTIFKDIKNPYGEGRVMVNLCSVYLARNQADMAEKANLASLMLCRATGDRLAEGWSYAGLGTFHFSCGNLEDAEKAYHKSLVIIRELGDRQGEARTLNHLGDVYKSWRLWSEAEKAYTDSLEISRELGDRTSEGRALISVAKLMEIQGKSADASAYAREAVNVLLDTEDTLTLNDVRVLQTELSAKV